MFFYTLGYSGYEDHGCTVLCHEKEFTKEEWEEIVLEASKKSAKKFYENELNRYNEIMKPYYMAMAEKEKAKGNLYRWASHLADAEHPYIDFSYNFYLLKHVVTCLIEDYEFSEMKYTHITYFWKERSLSEPHENDRYLSEIHVKLIDWVRENILASSDEYEISKRDEYVKKLLADSGYTDDQIKTEKDQFLFGDLTFDPE